MKKLDVRRCADGRMARTNASQRSDWLERLQASGLSVTAFAQLHGLCPSTLRRWIAFQPRQRNPTPRIKFQELHVPPAFSDGTANRGWDSEISLPSGVTVRLRGSLALELVRSVLPQSQS